MELSERKKRILKIAVDKYIDTAVPVSSKLIAEEYEGSISSATIRSEMSALEELGYLEQPHTSAGRIPSNEAYKLYVTDLMVKEKPTVKELDYIKKIFLEKTDDLEYLIKNTAKIISELTSYTSMAIAPHDTKDHITHINLFRYKPDSALVLIVTENKLLKDNYISLPPDMPDENLLEANELLTKLFVGKTLDECCDADFLIGEELAGYKSVFVMVIDALKSYIQYSESDLIVEGEDKILQHPEYTDIDKIRNFLRAVTSKDK
ncbi:MAG: heat-inducible transcription repressor HrcA, partial [Clostridia bacterium]|nr:heat-inducible transcription repressor HrcA [Clostridia bacterium]